MKCHCCDAKGCTAGNPCVPKDSAPLYVDLLDQRIAKAASEIEIDHYGKLNRIQETALFARKLGVRKIGLAFCMGFSEEAAVIGEFFASYFEVLSACCKIGGLGREVMGVPKQEGIFSVSCNPAEQAKTLEEAGSELHLILGLCVGHDTLFIRHSTVPVVPLAVKDRVLAHNPLGAIYCPYVRKHLNDIPGM